MNANIRKNEGAFVALKRIIGLFNIEYDYRSGNVQISRCPFSEDSRPDQVNAALEDGQITMDDLCSFVHERLMYLGKFEANKREKNIAIPRSETNILLCYAVTWGAVPWYLHTSDTDVGQALRLLEAIIRDLTTPFVPRELRRDFCC